MKKKVLFVIESMSGGGAEKVLAILLNNLDRTKFDITLCTVVDSGTNKQLLPQDIKYRSILRPPSSSNFIYGILYKLKYKLIYRALPNKWVYKLFIPKHNDIEISFVEGFTTKILAYSTNIPAKKIAWVHIDLINNHWIESIYRNHDEELHSYKMFNYVVGVSDTVRDSIKKLYNINNVITLYNPIDSRYISACSKAVDVTSCKIFTGVRTQIISTGRLVNQKGYDRLLRIIKKLIGDSFDLELTILGEGPERPQLQKYIDDNNLNSRVFLPGFVDNPYSKMAGSSLFVCSSRSEGYSTAVTEALILGLPVVTTNCSGMEELLNYGEYGIITDNNEHALYIALRDLLSSEERLLHYKQKASERGKYFNLDRLMQPIEKLLIQ